MMNIDELAFRETGYLKLEALLPRSVVDEVHALMPEYSASAPHSGYFGELVRDSVRVPSVMRMLESPPIVSLARALIGSEHVEVLESTLLDVEPGFDPTLWHRDIIESLSYVDAPAANVGPPMGSAEDFGLEARDVTNTRVLASASQGAVGRLGVVMAIYLHDVDEPRGPYRVLPKSHAWGPFGHSCGGAELYDRSPRPGELKLDGSAGTVIAHETSLWHTASENRSDRRCQMILAQFGPKQVAKGNRYLRRLGLELAP